MYFTVKINGKDLGKELNANSKADVMDYLMINKLANPTRDVIEIEEIEPKIETGKLLKGRFPEAFFSHEEISRHLNNLISFYGPELVEDEILRKFNLTKKRQRKVKAA